VENHKILGDKFLQSKGQGSKVRLVPCSNTKHQFTWGISKRCNVLCYLVFLPASNGQINPTSWLSDCFTWRYAHPVWIKGLSLEIFGPVYWPVWMHLGLNKNRFLFLNFKGAPSTCGRHFKFLCVSVQTFSEILRIPRRIGNWGLSCQSFSENWELKLPIILEDSTILWEIFPP
jgi:hypothetical protein